LANPVCIETGKDLKFGINVIQHPLNEIPLSLDKSYKINVEGNLYSEDNGATWLTLFSEGIDCNLAIIGNITNTDIATSLDRDENFIGYLLYRDGEIMEKKLLFQSVYTDHNVFFDQQHRYAASAYYNNGMESNHSPELVRIENLTPETTVKFYPNPAHTMIYIEGELTKVTLIDLNGKIIMETQNNTLSIGHLRSGIYILKVETGSQIAVGKVFKM
jgi:hypothetical protein